MKTSLLFFILIFSVTIFEKGLNDINLDIINTLGFIAVYTIPIFILELLIRKLLEKQVDNRKIYLGIFLRSLSIAVLSAFLWVLAIALLFRASLRGEEVMVYMITPIVCGIFFALNFILSLIILWFEKRKESQSFRKVSIIVLPISFILLVYGGWSLSKCDWRGCGNIGYLTARAIRENNPSICQLAGRNISSSSSFLIPSRFYGYNTSECYSLLGIKTNNAELCEIAEYEKGYCYKTLAENLINPKLCDKITDGDYQKDPCFNALAKKTKNLNLCNKISDSDYRKLCKSRIKE